MKYLINGDFGNLPALIAATASSDAARRGMRLRIGCRVWAYDIGSEWVPVELCARRKSFPQSDGTKSPSHPLRVKSGFRELHNPEM